MKNNLKGKVKSVITFNRYIKKRYTEGYGELISHEVDASFHGRYKEIERYDYEGRLIEYSAYRLDDNLIDSKKYVFDHEGRLIEKTIINSDSGHYFRVQNIYNLNDDIAQERSYNKNDSLRGTTQFNYNSNGQKIEENYYSSSGTLVGSKQFIYNSKSELEKIIIDSDEECDTEVLKYDSESRLIEHFHFTKYKKYDYEFLRWYTKYIYTDGGKEEHFAAEGAHEINRPDYMNDIVITEIKKFDLAGNLIKHFNERTGYYKHIHDKNSNLIEKICFDDETNISAVYSYFYDDNNNLIEERNPFDSSSDDVKREIYRYKYEYDHQGNWVEKQAFYIIGEYIGRSTSREIKYY